jgi:hypothetical protein
MDHPDRTMDRWPGCVGIFRLDIQEKVLTFNL